jgi:ATP-dependent Clp protease ATP-binding subunit ClpA
MRIIWQLAAQEAVQADFGLIEPAHLFMAALKLAEFEEDHFVQMGGDQRAVRELLKGRDAARHALLKLLIMVPGMSTLIRRALRARLGNGNQPNDGQAMHRSQDSRALCRQAEKIAGSQNLSAWEVSHLIEAAMDSPSPIIADVLLEFGIGKKDAASSPMLEAYGRLLCGSPGDSRSKDAQNLEKDAIYRVVIDAISGDGSSNILLIQKGVRSPRGVVEDIAFGCAGHSVPDELKGKRIIEFQYSAICTQSYILTHGPSELVAQFMGQARRAEDVILYIHDFKSLVDYGKRLGFLDLLHRELSQKGLLFIAGIHETDYRGYIDPDPRWDKPFRRIWIHDVEVPLQL